MPDGEKQEEMVPPEKGDRVSCTVEGDVDSIDGKMAYIKPVAVNGVPVEEEKPAEKSAELPGAGGEEDGYDQLAAQAKLIDRN